MTCPQVKKARAKTQQIRDANKELAVQNVELEPKFTDIKKELLERTSELHVLKEEYDKRILELSESFKGVYCVSRVGCPEVDSGLEHKAL